MDTVDEHPSARVVWFALSEPPSARGGRNWFQIFGNKSFKSFSLKDALHSTTFSVSY